MLFSPQVNSGSSSCAVDNLADLKLKCQNTRRDVRTMVIEAYDQTQGLLGDCTGPLFDLCGWRQRTLTPEQCSAAGLDELIPNCSCSQ